MSMKSFWKGFFSINLFPSFDKPKAMTAEEAVKRDKKVIEEDCKKIGNDLRKAMRLKENK